MPCIDYLAHASTHSITHLPRLFSERQEATAAPVLRPQSSDLQNAARTTPLKAVAVIGYILFLGIIFCSWVQRGLRDKFKRHLVEYRSI
mmetsp:Transcript_21033/g.41252  ORF Transcript_21033/g.41252 Transcript_21033/m.41252 type:complete len:89 (-) Transcript_21033:5983-6249(-)